MVIEEDWGIAPERMAAFLAGEPEVLATAEGFVFRDCRVVLTGCTRQALGKWPVRRTRVTITGSQEAARALQRRIFLRFLSAGG